MTEILPFSRKNAKKSDFLLARTAREKKIRLFFIFPGEWKDFGHTTPLQNAVFASTTLDYRFNSGKYIKFFRNFGFFHREVVSVLNLLIHFKSV